MKHAWDGCLFVQPGSHAEERAARQAGEVARGALHSSKTITGSEALPHATPILAEPGTAIVFDKDLLHAGGPNLSSGVRYALYYRLRLE